MSNSQPNNELELATYQSIKRVQAGVIIRVHAHGCVVRCGDGRDVIRLYQPEMTARYTPVEGDYWIVYPGGYASISPRDAFLAGYVELTA